MTLSEFKKIAKYMGAHVVFETAPVATFKGAKYDVTMELSSEQLQAARPLDICSAMADFGMLS